MQPRLAAPPAAERQETEDAGTILAQSPRRQHPHPPAAHTRHQDRPCMNPRGNPHTRPGPPPRQPRQTPASPDRTHHPGTTGQKDHHAAVARTADVSTWLTYTEGIREQVEAAQQRRQPTIPTLTCPGAPTRRCAKNSSSPEMRSAPCGRTENGCRKPSSTSSDSNSTPSTPGTRPTASTNSPSQPTTRRQPPTGHRRQPPAQRPRWSADCPRRQLYGIIPANPSQPPPDCDADGDRRPGLRTPTAHARQPQPRAWT